MTQETKIPNQGAMFKDSHGEPFWTGPEDAQGRPRLSQYDTTNNEYYRKIDVALRLADELMTGDKEFRPKSFRGLDETIKASSCWVSLNSTTRPIVELRLIQKWNKSSRSGCWTSGEW